MKPIRTLATLSGLVLAAAWLTGCGDDDGQQVCGNDLVEGTEQCDGAELDGNSCTTIQGGFTGGTLACDNQCAFDTSQCTTGQQECGNNVTEAGEDCDGVDLGGNACTDVGSYTGGTLDCNANCTWDVTGCVEDPCGNGNIDTGEDCDGVNLDGNDCTDVGNYTGGTLGCDTDCTFDTTLCDAPVSCGNGTIDAGEDCDGSNLGGNDCADVGSYNSGTLGCENDCTWDVSGCEYILSPSEEIAAVRATSDGTGYTLPVGNVWVTYVKAALGDDVAGFFVQAEQSGPALFVSVDPQTLNPVPAVGDDVSFTVTEIETVEARRQIAAITGWAVNTSGHDVTTLTQGVSTATDLVSALGDYEVELISLDATIVGAGVYGGAGHTRHYIDTAGIVGDNDLMLRLSDTLATTLDLEPGCLVSVSDTPLWRYYTDAQVSAYAMSDIAVTSCPPPQVLSAGTTGDQTVVITMSRDIAPASITDASTQITFDNGLSATGAAVNGKEITVMTSAQTAGATYIVTVANTVTDTRGVGVDPAANTAAFLGFGTPVFEAPCNDGIDGDGDGYIDCLDADCAGDAACSWGSQLYLWELDADQPGADTAEFVEIWNNTGAMVDFDGADRYFLILINGSTIGAYDQFLLTGTVAAGDVFVVGNTAGADMVLGGAIQNDAEGILLVQCNTCSDVMTDFPDGWVPSGYPNYTSGNGRAVTWIDSIAHDSGDADIPALMTALGVTLQFNEGSGTAAGLQRTSPGNWTQALPSPGMTGIE